MARRDRSAAQWHAWMGQVVESAIDPQLPICDPHHHLWLDEGHMGWPYTLDDFHADTARGHNVVRSVFLECRTAYASDGPPHLRQVAEVAFAAELAEASARSGKTEIAGIVGHADLADESTLEEVLAAHEAAGRGRFRGIRYSSLRDDDPGLARPPCAALDDERYRAGVRKLGALGYAYDALVYHPQLRDLAAVARACPQTTMVINHLGCFVGVGPYRAEREANLRLWLDSLAEVARSPNTFIKLGGIGMPMMGIRWDKQDAPATSAALVDAWADPIRRIIDTFGPHRCMFESNFPVDGRGAGYVVLWNAFKQIAARYTPSEKRDLFHDSAARAYRLPLLAEGA